MSTPPFPQAAMASLEAHSVAIAEEATRRMCAGIPGYDTIPQDRLVAQNTRTVQQIARMIDESNFPVAREYFEKLTQTRARAGVPIEAFLRAVELMMDVITEHIQQTFAHDPAYRDHALHVLHAGTLFTRNIIGRTHLREVVEQAKRARPEQP